MAKPTAVYKKRNLDARLRKVEKIQRARRPEVKRHHIYLNDTTVATGAIVSKTPTFIEAGTALGQRVGNEISVLSVSIRVYIPAVPNNSGALDVFLIQAVGDSPDLTSGITSYLDFIPAVGGGLLDIYDHGGTYKQLRHYNFVDGPNLQIYHKFKSPLRVRYDGNAAGDCTNNKLFVVLKNSSGADIPGTSMVCTINYIDN